jgi:hypothetical protein
VPRNSRNEVSKVLNLTRASTAVCADAEVAASIAEMHRRHDPNDHVPETLEQGCLSHNSVIVSRTMYIERSGSCDRAAFRAKHGVPP